MPPTHDSLYRGDGTGRPAGLPLPPADLPLRRDGGWRKRWRYVAAFDDRVMLCVGSAQVGVGRTGWWAVWDRERRELSERTRVGRGTARFSEGHVGVRDGGVEIDLLVEEGSAVESVCRHGRGWVWTRKQAARPARGRVVVGGRQLTVDGLAVVDDTAGFHARATAWRWSAGAGRTTDGRVVGWNLVEGVNDPPAGSERSVWVDGTPAEVGPVRFAPGLDEVAFAEGGTLRFAAEAVREREDDLKLFRSSYRQPFGTFTGRLPGGLELAGGAGVMERHDARW